MVRLWIIGDDCRDHLRHVGGVDERGAAALREADHRRLVGQGVGRGLCARDGLAEVATPVLFTREDVLAVEKHGVVAEPGNGGGDRLVVIWPGVSGQQ